MFKILLMWDPELKNKTCIYTRLSLNPISEISLEQKQSANILPVKTHWLLTIVIILVELIFDKSRWLFQIRKDPSKIQ